MRKIMRTRPNAKRPPGRAGALRRRGSVLILVVTLLGILFVTGMTFLATVAFESQIITVEETFAQHEAGIDLVQDQIGEVLRTTFEAAPGIAYNASLGMQVQAVEWQDAQGAVKKDWLFRTRGAPFAGVPDVNPLLAQIEPYWVTDAQGNQYLSYEAFTDLEAIYRTPLDIFKEYNSNPATQSLQNWRARLIPVELPGYQQFGQTASVDSDGDGIVDTLQFDLLKLGFSPASLSAIRQQVNPVEVPDGPVYLGLRVVSHGGMVNLSDSNPVLVYTVMGANSANDPDFTFAPPYSPLLEESNLRRRGGLLPPRTFSPSALYGNPLDDDPEGPQGDMTQKLLASGETIREGEHRYWPYVYDRDLDDLMDFQRWMERTDPWDDDNYSLQQLVTTVSHDNLLARGGSGLGYELLEEDTNGDGVIDVRRYASQSLGDAVGRMRRANKLAENVAQPNAAPIFEYPNYPHDVADACDETVTPDCTPNRRKGRLQLSLPWLDKAAGGNGNDALLTAGQRIRLIQDVFTVMLSQASGAYWQEARCSGVGQCDADEVCAQYYHAGAPLTEGVCADPALVEEVAAVGGTLLEKRPLSRRLAKISRTAAALTANLIDFADKDETPTRVELRSTDFADYLDPDAPADLDRVGPHAAGKPFQARRYVYGLERQPYISEITVGYVYQDPLQPDTSDGIPDYWAVELFNPYGEPAIDTETVGENGRYYLVVADSTAGYNSNTKLPFGAETVNLNGFLQAGKFTVYWYTLDNGFPDMAYSGAIGTTGQGEPLNNRVLHFWGEADTSSNLDMIYLVRDVEYDGEVIPVVVDQFEVPASMPEKMINYNPGTALDLPKVISYERMVMDPADGWNVWTVTVPEPAECTDSTGVNTHSLGGWNVNYPVDAQNPIRPVEVNFANPLVDWYQDRGQLQQAFPTTGSLLLLTRFGNYDFSAMADPDQVGVQLTNELAFTTRLTETVEPVTLALDTQTGECVAVPGGTVVAMEKEIDNGHLPVFDVAKVHRLDPANFNCVTLPNTPGDIDTLPWGQYVFDYFTAIPLASLGPNVNPDNDPDWSPDEWAPPRVDMDGLRVHGRIDLNAAPWRVLAGLPLMSSDRFPEAFREKLRLFAGVPDDFKTEVMNIGQALAQAIVAYRDGREIVDPVDSYTTGNFYALRGWGAPTVSMRRGTGLLTVGELANVRSDNATAALAMGLSSPVTAIPDNVYSFYRMDAGVLEASAGLQDFVGAVAPLVLLGDWVTVRSDVYTVYGTFRGDPAGGDQPTPMDVTEMEGRAIRFQETLDRLPTFLGEPAPARIGQRIEGRYTDAHRD